MEDKILKSREDFETESDWWTYRVIHEEEFRALEEANKPKEEYPYLIIQCLKCGAIIDENETKPDITIPYHLRVSCKCGNKSKFKAISETKKKEILQKKQKENLSDYRIKRIIKRIEIDLEKVQDDLTEDLKEGRISPERYIVLMLNLFSREYDYYSRTVGKKFDWKNFRDTSLEIAKKQVEQKYECEILDEKLAQIANEYDEEKDKYFLEEYEIMLNGRMQDEEDKGRIEELEREIKRVERQKKLVLDYEEKRTNSKKAVVEKYIEKAEDDAIWDFKKQLKKDLKKVNK